MSSHGWRAWLAGCILLVAPAAGTGQTDRPDPVKNPKSPVLLDLPGSGTDASNIDYTKLPQLRPAHGVVCPPDPTLKFQLHSYLVRHGGRFWCMWSQGPPVEDEPTQQVRYATSDDGLKWGEPKPLSGPLEEGYGYIARGFWVRDGELLALAAHFKGKGAFGVNKDLQLRAFAWDPKAGAWKSRGLVFADAINNFAPQKLSTGEWMMTRRDARFNVYMLTGGVKALDDWRVAPVARFIGRTDKFRPDEPIWWPLAGKNLVAVFRDNGGSSRLFRAFSTDEGKTWSPPVQTNFPNSSSKVFSLATSGGYRVLVSNANPAVGRRQLHLSVSEDGLVFGRVALLAIPSARPSTLQYPHAIEHDGHLFIAFSRNKATIEVIKLPLGDIAALRGKGLERK
jgi:hypothetical protein